MVFQVDQHLELPHLKIGVISVAHHLQQKRNAQQAFSAVLTFAIALNVELCLLHTALSGTTLLTCI